MLIAAIGFLLVVFLIYKFGTLVSGELLHYFYREPIEKLSPEELNTSQQIFFNTVFTLLGALAKSDGHVDQSEIKITESYMGKMGLDASQRKTAIQLFKAGASPEFKLEPILNSFEGLAQKNSNLTEILLVYLVNLARIDGVMAEVELALLHKIANGLGYTSIAFEHLIRMIASQNRFTDAPLEDGKNGKSQSSDYMSPRNDVTNAYDALGVTANASDREIKQAYRKLMNQYHPDKLMGQGLPEFVIKAATERVKRIQAAYEYIKQNRK